jgi:hypothetical protein
MPRRLLLGSHDVEGFTTEMARWPAVRDLIAALAATGQAPDDPRRAAAVRGRQRPGRLQERNHRERAPLNVSR